MDLSDYEFARQLNQATYLKRLDQDLMEGVLTKVVNKVFEALNSER